MPSTDPLPAAYRTLLAAHPAGWRRRHGEVVLTTLLDAHAAIGRRRPTLAERARFAADGIRISLGAALLQRSSISVRRPAVPLGSLHVIDQTGGAVPESDVDPAAQARANLRDASSADLRHAGPSAWIGLGRWTRR